MSSQSHPHPADYSNSCIPSAIPPNMDPSMVDFREFYPYIPNEVKHRKRTTPAQLEVLEDTYKRDKKPNSALRTALARDLDMLPRGVQVWFQNRRAKEKNMAKKVIQRRNNDNVNPNLNLSSNSPELDHLDDKKSTSPSSERPDSTSAPSPIPAIRYDMPPHPRFPTFSGDANLRRGSLPIIMRSTSDDPTAYSRRLAPSHDPLALARRSSFDTNIGRLATHPYAALAFANNSAIYGKVVGSARHHMSIKSGSLPGGPEQLLRSPRVGSRLGSVHRASMPYIHAQSHRSVSSGGISHISHDGPFDHAQIFTSKRHDGMYVMPSRVVHTPIDGPLPTPNFSFGDSSSSPSAPSPPASECSEHMSRGLNNYAFPNDPDTEDDRTHSSFDAFSSRFGSITSLAGSESSMTSAYYSETGSCVSDLHEYPSGFEPDSRRPSHSSGNMLDHFSALELGTQTSPAIPTGGFGQDLMLSARSPNESESNEENSPATTTYPSPASTISSGGNPQNQSVEGNVRISLSSELALALSSSAGDSVVKQELSDSNLKDSQVKSGRLETSRSDSSPMLDPGNVLGNASRACYDLEYADHSFGVFDDQPFGSQQGHYGTSPYPPEGQSPHNLATTNPSHISVSVYPTVQEVFR